MSANNTDKLLEKIFTEEWVNSIVVAINFAIDKLRPSHKEALDIAQRIIDYNIEKRLNEVIIESSNLILPKALNWTNIDADDAFLAFRMLLEAYDLSNRTRSHSVKIDFGENNLLYNEFLIWKENIRGLGFFNLLLTTSFSGKSSVILKIKRR